MSIFVDYLSKPFVSVANTPTELLKADSGVLLVGSIIVCNKSSGPIRFNLQKLRNGENDIFLVNEFQVDAYQSVDILEKLGLRTYLQYSSVPAISDSLICYSNGYSQEFDCDIAYTRLNETI